MIYLTGEPDFAKSTDTASVLRQRVWFRIIKCLNLNKAAGVSRGMNTVDSPIVANSTNNNSER